MDLENKDKTIDKDVAKQLVLSGKTPLEQLTELTRIVYKVGREVLPGYLNEWYHHVISGWGPRDFPWGAHVISPWGPRDFPVGPT